MSEYESKLKNKAAAPLAGVVWWVKLVVAVAAVGSVAAAASLLITDNAWLQGALFVLLCWGGAWAGKKIGDRTRTNY